MKSLNPFFSILFLFLNSFFLRLGKIQVFLLDNGFCQITMKLMRPIRFLLLFEIVDHVIHDVLRVLVDYFDHHFAENRIDVVIDVL